MEVCIVCRYKKSTESYLITPLQHIHTKYFKVILMLLEAWFRKYKRIIIFDRPSPLHQNICQFNFLLINYFVHCSVTTLLHHTYLEIPAIFFAAFNLLSFTKTYSNKYRECAICYVRLKFIKYTLFIFYELFWRRL